MNIQNSGMQHNPINKALSRSESNPFELNDLSPIVESEEVSPKLLTAMFGGEASSQYLVAKNTVTYDRMEHTSQLPNGKRFDEYGQSLLQDGASTDALQVGSFGLQSKIAPMDYAGRRIPGTEELMNEEYLATLMLRKSQKSWNDFNELMWGQLLTQDTNITLGGNHIEYNYYDRYVGGGARPVETIDLSGASIDIHRVMQTEADKLDEDLDKTMNSSSMKIMLCGAQFFDSRAAIEGDPDLGRDFRKPLDLATMEVPSSNFGTGDGTYRYRYFDSHDGIRYIRYDVRIQGSPIIATDKGFMMPVGAENFVRQYFAPAQTRTYVNTEALSKYAWSHEDDRQGVTLIEECNVLPVLVNPQLIRHYQGTF